MLCHRMSQSSTSLKSRATISHAVAKAYGMYGSSSSNMPSSMARYTHEVAPCARPHCGRHVTRSSSNTIRSAITAPATSPPRAASSRHLATWRHVSRFAAFGGQVLLDELARVSERSQRRDARNLQRPGQGPRPVGAAYACTFYANARHAEQIQLSKFAVGQLRQSRTPRSSYNVPAVSGSDRSR